MPFYSGNYGFYKEKQKFYVENEVFQRKTFRNAVLQWKLWFLSAKTQILRRKRGFLVGESTFHLKIVRYSGKFGFYPEKRKFYVENDVFLSKTAVYIYSSTFWLKTQFLSGDTKILYVVNDVFQRKILEMPIYSGKYGFYQEKHKFLRENEVFLSKTALYI